MRSANSPRPPRGRDDPSNVPLLATMDLLGQRWILRILWELEPDRLGFLELRRRMGNCSSSMLSVRLQHLQSAGLIAKNPDKSYELTTAGSELGTALGPVWDWSRRWRVTPTESGTD
ncbi:MULTISPECIES: winged helix-turn-helix transcriptional regulator [Nocardia]|jgi:DNA-binding HxlR family transcriptional regulator|uniref:winged helix-turn-helix transcriptional regulator n=1 Tax=Nocardia TaxID=1817 RepID=UPI0015EED4B9|nr:MULTISPECIES: helix-turn-helix domain-containing protein [Nocardia]MBF6217875.1 helix-turn-helix transcriptional regulator [Nocardia abscessus]MBF6470783.1 helix-turn-helix transcriptional regulator [Nocardia abscessus]